MLPILAFICLFVLAIAGPIPVCKSAPGYLKLQAKEHRRHYNCGYGKKKAYYSFNKNGNSVDSHLENQVDFYNIEVQLGSNSQTLHVTLDTGSSDFWVNWNGNPYCRALDSGNQNYDSSRANEQTDPQVLGALQRLSPSVFAMLVASMRSNSSALSSLLSGSATQSTTGGTNGSPAEAPYPSATFNFVATQTAVPSWYDNNNVCSNYGMFDFTTSNSYLSNNTLFAETYATPSYAIGIWSKDLLSVGGVKVPNMTFGLGLISSTNVGILGIGLPDGEISLQGEYANLPIMLQKQGSIKRQAYSIYLGSEGTDNSHIVFGGIDKAKFQSRLSLLPLMPAYGLTPASRAVAVTLSGLYAYEENPGPSWFGWNYQKTSLLAAGQASALFDTGATVSSMPYYLINAIVGAFKNTLKYSAALGGYVANCRDLTGKALIFDFQGVKIKVPMIALMADVVDFNKRDTGLCYLALRDSGVDELLLGDTFLRSVYFMVDIENKQMGLAQALPYVSNEYIQTIPEKDKPIPSATTAPFYSKTYGANGITTMSLATPVNPATFQTTTVPTSVIADFFFPLPQ